MRQFGGKYSIDHFDSNHCSPGSTNKGSCINDKLIIKIAKIVNNLINDEHININESTNNIHDNLCRIIKNLTKCSSESCWLNINEIINKLNNNEKNSFFSSFRPLMPKKWIKTNYKEWLNTLNIEDCLNQYDKAIPEFLFYGAVPIDFSKCSVNRKLCNFNLNEHINNNISKIGIVFNTDEHDEPGEHWISMYIDIKGNNMNKIPGIYFFDSFGNKAPDEVLSFVNKIKEQGKKLNINFKYLYNDYSHQNRNNQCGVYCINFIIGMLKNKNFKYYKYKNSDLNDNKMILNRKKYFIKPQKIKIKKK
jgi:hypothetical protein